MGGAAGVPGGEADSHRERSTAAAQGQPAGRGSSQVSGHGTDQRRTESRRARVSLRERQHSSEQTDERVRSDAAGHRRTTCRCRGQTERQLSTSLECDVQRYTLKYQ